MAPKSLSTIILSGKKRKRRYSTGVIRSAISPLVRKQRAARSGELKRNKALYASIIGIPVIGDLILAFSSPKDTPDVVYAVTNSQKLNTTVEWMRSRIVPTKTFAQIGYMLDGIEHSPTSDDRDVARVYDNGTKFWMHWKCFHRGNDLPALIGHNGYKAWYHFNALHRDNDQPAILNPLHKHAHWYQNGVWVRSIGNSEFDAYVAAQSVKQSETTAAACDSGDK